MSVDDVTDDNSDDDVALNADQLPVDGCVSGETDVKELQERDDSLSACWEMVKAGKRDCVIDNGYLAERICECIRLSLYSIWLLCCLFSFCIFVSGSQLGWAIAENEVHAIIWALSQIGRIVCGYQFAEVCEYNLLQYVFYLKCQIVALVSVFTLSTPEVLRMWWLITSHVCESCQ